MTPFSSLLGRSHVGNSRLWDWILYTVRWLHKGIIQDGYCAIRNVMKLAQRWQLYRGRSLLIYGDLLQYNIEERTSRRGEERRAGLCRESLAVLGDSGGLCVCSSPCSVPPSLLFFSSFKAFVGRNTKKKETIGSQFPETKGHCFTTCQCDSLSVLQYSAASLLFPPLYNTVCASNYIISHVLIFTFVTNLPIAYFSPCK